MKKLLLLLFLGILVAPPLAAQDKVKKVWLFARTISWDTMYDGTAVPTWGFADRPVKNILLPGPELHFNEGDSVWLHVKNISQGDPHTVHLHGLDLPTEFDGVPGLSFDIPHGDTGIYKFRANHAGTYVYHCHVHSVVHVQMGMYGALIVHAKDGKDEAFTGGPQYREDFTMLLSEVDLDWHLDPPGSKGGAHLHDSFQIPPYRPDYFLINGKSEDELEHLLGDSPRPINSYYYFRFANMGYCYARITWPGFVGQGELWESDGRPAPEMKKVEQIEIFPGERYGLALLPSEDNHSFMYVEWYDMATHQMLNRQLVPLSFAKASMGDAPMAGSLKAWKQGSGNLMLELPENERLKGIEILNLSGQSVVVNPAFSPVGNHTWQVSMPPVAPGVYLIRVLTDKGARTAKISF